MTKIRSSLAAAVFVAASVVGYLLHELGSYLDMVRQPPPYAWLVPLFGVLAATIVYERRRRGDNAQRDRDGELLAQQAFHDSLTDLPNRLLLRDRLAYQLAAMKRAHINVALLMIDLDGFKQTNDSLGHLAGDELLIQVADRIRQTSRETDTVARIGGDEFAVLQPVEEHNQAALLANRIIASLSQPFVLSRGRVQIGCSIGITITEDPDVRLEELIDEADFALYQSKKLGGNTLTFFDRHSKALLHTDQAFEAALREAIATETISVCYARQHDRDGRWTGLDADLVWDHPERGAMSLATVLATAQDRHLRRDLVDYFLFSVGRDTPLFAGLQVTISGIPFLMPDRSIVEQLCANSYGLLGRGCKIFLSISCTDLEHIGARGLSTLDQLERRGLGLVIECDDSSPIALSSVARLRPDRIKISRQFIAALETAPHSSQTVEDIANMALSRDIELLADGVTSRAQLRLLLDLGCRLMQGPLWGEPATAQALGAQLQRQQEPRQRPAASPARLN